MHGQFVELGSQNPENGKNHCIDIDNQISFAIRNRMIKK